MDAKGRQQWTEEEIQCFLALWSSSQVQNKLGRNSRSRLVFESIQREMAAVGYDRTLKQLMTKMKKLKEAYRAQKKEVDCGGGGRPRTNPHFDLLDSVLGDKPANQTTGALNSATASVAQTSNDSDSELLTLDENAELSRQSVCNSPSPSCSVSSRTPSSSSAHQTRSTKRKRDSTADLLEYLERSEERFQEQSKRDQEFTTALLHNMRRMEDNASALVGLMGRMVSVLEGLSQR